VIPTYTALAVAGKYHAAQGVIYARYAQLDGVTPLDAHGIVKPKYIYTS
jgi:hypothetical protein